MAEAHTFYQEALLLLGGAVIAAPIFKRLGLGTILGYLAAGILIGPIAQLITGAQDILGFAELGVVFLLFIVGLELKPSRLWQMRKDIFGLGSLQVIITGSLLASILSWSGILGWRASIIAGFGLSLSSTAFALQILGEKGDMNLSYGRRSFSLLLFQDLAIVPLLAIIPLLSPWKTAAGDANPYANFAIAIAAIAALIAAGRYLLNPALRLIARAGAREAMIAAALFAVLGAAVVAQQAGLSMAMGAFLAGVMLAESNYRHELEADIEPFRGILLGLFFMAVGMSVNLQAIWDNIFLVLAAVPAMMAIKFTVLYLVCRVTGSNVGDAARIGLLLPQGGEFGFVLFSAASAAYILSPANASLLISIVTLSMALTPLAIMLERFIPQESPETIVEDFEGAGADVLMIGFSRFGQIASQVLLAGGRDVTIIESSADRIHQAAQFGFRIYFGDGTRKDVLRAAGIESAKIVAVCTHKREVTDRIVDLVQSEYPHARVYARAYDRVHTLSLRARGVAYEARETFESGLLFGRKTLEGLGENEEMALEISDDIRKRDAARLSIQQVEGIMAGRDMLHTRPVLPEPLMKPKRHEDG